MALAYAREGADVVVSYWKEHDDANETKKVVEQAGRQCLLIVRLSIPKQSSVEFRFICF